MTSNIVSFNSKLKGATNIVHYIDAYTDCNTNYGDVKPLDASNCYTKVSGVLYDSNGNAVDETKNYYTTISGEIETVGGPLTYDALKIKIMSSPLHYSETEFIADVNDLKNLVNGSYDPSFNYIINQHENKDRKSVV